MRNQETSQMLDQLARHLVDKYPDLQKPKDWGNEANIFYETLVQHVEDYCRLHRWHPRRAGHGREGVRIIYQLSRSGRLPGLPKPSRSNTPQPTKESSPESGCVKMSVGDFLNLYETTKEAFGNALCEDGTRDTLRDILNEIIAPFEERLDKIDRHLRYLVDQLAGKEAE